jgi:nucleotide-binding universal stress UspA family protein
MIPIRSILVPVDFSKHSAAALARAVEWAKLFGARIHVLHCYALPVRGVTPYEFAVPAAVWDSIRDATLQRVGQMRDEVAAKGVEATADVSPLLPTQAIAEEATRLGADLIVMGTRGNTGLKHVLLGSVAERTLRTAPCPVLTVTDEDEAALRPMARILVAVDFSEHSNRALETAMELARRLRAELHLVHAFDIPVPLVTPYEIAIPDALIEQARDTAARKLEKALQKVRAEGIEGRSHLTEVPAAAAIVRVAEETKADLIVMGTRGHTGLKHLLLGSVAERTVRHAPCSVLTLRTPAE